MQVIINGKPYSVADLDAASVLVDQKRGRMGGKAWDARNPGGVKVTDGAGGLVARVSYNGRVWGLDGVEIRTRGKQTAAEMMAGWAARSATVTL